jgi:DNA replication protein DnaC
MGRRRAMDNSVNIKSLAKSLRMPIFQAYDEYVKPGMSVEEALIELMSQEHDRRHEASVKRRIRSAGLPNGKTIDTFKLVPSVPHLKEEQIQALMTCKFIENGTNVCALGGSGTGKSHIMAAISREAVQLGYTVKYLRVSDMLTMLHEASSEKKLNAMSNSLMKVNLLSLDELGYITLNTRKSQFLFDVIAKRNQEGGSIFVTSNFEFSRWGKFIADDVMVKALVGKLAGGAVILNMNGEDYRLASRKQ